MFRLGFVVAAVVSAKLLAGSERRRQSLPRIRTVVRIGLTGGIGAGKSTVAHRFAELGAVVIDADALAREVVDPGSPGLTALVREFGAEILRPDGALDRPALGRLVFGDDGARARMNAIIHPLIAARTAPRLAEVPDDAVWVHDVPLLVENGLAPNYQLVVVVDAPVETRVRRLVGRGMGEDDARARIRAQATEVQRRAVADVWIDNAGTPEQAAAQVDACWQDRIAPLRS